MSEERKLVLQMVADGKITPAEAERLLTALDEGNRSGGHSRSALESLGESIDRAINHSIKVMDTELRSLEARLEQRLREEELRPRMAERIRRVAQRAAGRFAERVERAGEQAVGRATEFIKVGVVVDRERVEQVESLSLTAEPGDRLVVENRLGDVELEVYDGSLISVDVTKQVWGETQEDAEARAAATRVDLIRQGEDVIVQVQRPTLVGVGVVVAKETALDYVIRVPRGIRLDLCVRSGDLTVHGGDHVSDWRLSVQAGDVKVRVGPGAGFQYHLESRAGEISLDLPGTRQSGEGCLTGRVGDESGSMTISVKVGDIALQGESGGAGP